MNTIQYEFGTNRWALNNFGNVQLFDLRRTRRLVSMAARLAENKGSSLARLFDNWYDTKAVYNLIKLDVMTPEVIQSDHRELTKENIINWEGDVLLIEDGSEFEWNGLEPIEGLGPIGSGRKGDQGFILHSTLAVGVVDKPNNATNEFPIKILGLPYQQYYVRPPKREKTKRRREVNETLETDLWRGVLRNKILPKEASKKIIRVCDRAADIYEVLEETKDQGYNYIIRIKHDRADNHDWEVKLFESFRELPAIGLTTIERRGRDGKGKRTIPLNINWQEVSLRAPARPGYQMGELPPLEVTVVRVWGLDTETEELIEWFLYTNLAINDFKAAIRIVKYYSLRWIIEDYHKALKSGLRAEKLQLETAHALFAAIAIMSVVALRLVDLREALRIDPEAPAEESGLNVLELKVLSFYLKREIRTVKCVALAIGRLGGHQNRKSDGMPGLMTLWLGMSRLLSIVEGVKLKQLIDF
jgi:hypothetical protein